MTSQQRKIGEMHLNNYKTKKHKIKVVLHLYEQSKPYGLIKPQSSDIGSPRYYVVIKIYSGRKFILEQIQGLSTLGFYYSKIKSQKDITIIKNNIPIKILNKAEELHVLDCL